MFSAAEMQLIRNHHLADYESLLRDLSISIPNWKSGGDELRVYDEIDELHRTFEAGRRRLRLQRNF